MRHEKDEAISQYTYLYGVLCIGYIGKRKENITCKTVYMVYHLLSEGGEEIHTHTHSYIFKRKHKKDKSVGETLGRRGNERQKQERK